MAPNVSFLQDLLATIAEQGRQYLPAVLAGGRKPSLEDLTKALVSNRGEASGVAIARQVLASYRAAPPEQRVAFFDFLAEHLEADGEAIAKAAASYLAAPSGVTLQALQHACESPRQEFFRRLNLAAGATAEIVQLRRDLIAQARLNPALSVVDNDLQHLLSSWFNRGFLVLRRIDWQTPAAILEKIIAYEAVHEIKSWDDLRRRLDPVDRRCFAFFHPSLVDEPLIFVEVALMSDMPGSIQAVLKERRKASAGAPSTAVFYSISNCQEGLRGISFGNFLIKQVVDDLAKEVPSLKTFVTLSPVPTFARWLERIMAGDKEGLLSQAELRTLAKLKDPRWIEAADEGEAVKAALMPLAAHYFLRAKSADGRPIDPVARFHLGNGARLERINWLGDVSEKGLSEAHGLMVNYKYDLAEIETNHEAYENQGTVAVAKGVRGLLKPLAKPPVTAQVEGPKTPLALPSQKL